MYTGENTDFGFWTKNINGSYSYTSIPVKYNFKLLEDEEFWNILEFKNWIVFQSLNRLVFFDPISDEISSIEPDGGVFKSFVIDNNLSDSTVSMVCFHVCAQVDVLFVPHAFAPFVLPFG